MEKPSLPGRRRGSALIAVISFVSVLAMLSSSMLLYTISERRANERVRLLLRARNMAENAAVYASEQLTTKLYRLRSPAPIAFMTGSNQIYLPPDSVLTTLFSLPADVEVRAGLTSSTGLTYIDPLLAANAGNPNAGLSVSTSTVPIIAKSTMRHPSIGAITSYAEQDLQIALMPLFQFAVFYNMDMEYGPGPNMTVSGPVHTNGNLIARIQTGFSNTLWFTDRVTAAGGFFANTAYKGSTFMADGSEDDGPGGTGPLQFQNPAGTVTNIKNASGVWRDHLYGASAASATTLNQFKTFASATYGGNLRTSVHGVTKLNLPSIGDYKEVDDPATPEDDRKNGRQVIEVPSASDAADVIQSKFSRNAGLYILVNPDNGARTGTMPDGTTINVLARSYRCWLNTINSSGSHTMLEVILPGQPSFGYNNNGTPGDTTDDTMYKNNMPNRFTDLTSIGMNQVLRIPLSGRAADTVVSAAHVSSGSVVPGYRTDLAGGGYFADAYFYDLRRATNNTGVPWNRGSNAYTPRPISKIDFDLTRFRLAIERTMGGASVTTSSPIYDPKTPSVFNWNNSIFNSAATRTTHRLGVNYGPISGGPTINNYSGFPNNTSTTPAYFADPFRIYYAPNPTDPLILTNPNSFAVPNTGLVGSSGASPFFDGITVYINSVGAEIKDGTRDDSGVRLWNGRGPLISLDGATYPARTGFSFASNDAVYIVGHYNADGTINSTMSSTGVGGYSGRYPESSSEMLTSVMGDAITVLSQPLYTKDGSNLYQVSGWADSLSAHRRESSGGYSSSWATSNPSGGNTMDGVNISLRPASMPNLSDIARNPGNSAAGNENAKFDPNVTEVSTCFLTGIVPTNSHQTSGGVHNFIRLSENWNGTGLYIRGSMVAMFQSQVATEPWSIRIYQGAGRFWGLHESLRDVNHDLPLEPVVLSAQRMRYTEITPAQYASQKTTIEALPH